MFTGLKGAIRIHIIFFCLSLNDKILLPQFEDLSSNLLTTLSCPYVQKLKIHSEIWHPLFNLLCVYCLLPIWDYYFDFKFLYRHIYPLTFFSAVGLLGAVVYLGDKSIWNPSIYNIIRWIAWTMGQTNHQPSVWCSKYYFFSWFSCKILCKNPFN